MKKTTNTHIRIKEEIDIDWDERDNCYGETFDNGQRECIPRVLLEKLPESVLEHYVDKKKAASGRTAQFSEKFRIQCAHCPHKTRYKSALIRHLSRAHKSKKNVYQDEYDNARKYSRMCEKCNKPPEGINPRKCERCSNKLLYKCNRCAKLFKTHSLFVYHWSTRCGVKGYFKCTKCDFKSVWRSKVIPHMNLMHKNLNLTKELKNIEWISLNCDNATVKSNTYECPKCTKTIENASKLSLHIEVCGGLECAKNSEMLSKKRIEVHNVDPKLSLSKCSSCGKQFDHIYSLNDHIHHCKKRMEYITKGTDDEVVTNAKPDHPSESLISADKRYARYIKMVVRYCIKCQEDSAMEEKNRGIGSKVSCRKCETTLIFKCTKCLKECTDYKVMKYHLDTICNPKEELKCTKCNYKSYTPKIIKEHYFSKHVTANLECKRCGRKFIKNYQLKNHLLRCGVEPIFQCDHCLFKSKRKFYLKTHIFDNHMEPVAVDRRDRGKMTRQRFRWAVSHITAHCSKCKNEQLVSNRRKVCAKCKTKLRFQCKTCAKNYNVDGENACIHVKIYLEAIKFECKRCGRGLNSKSNLCTHERHCIDKLTFKCRFCKYAAKYKASVQFHEKVIHLNEA